MGYEGEHKASPIRTNLRMVELLCIESEHLGRHSRFLLAGEVRLPTIVSMLDCLLSEQQAWSICWLVFSMLAAPVPGLSVQRTASPPTPALLPASVQTTEASTSSARPVGRLGALFAPCSPRWPSAARGSEWLRSHQLSAHSTASRSSSWAELGCFWRLFIWQPERMRRPINRKAERTLRCPASASMSTQLVSRTRLAPA